MYKVLLKLWASLFILFARKFLVCFKNQEIGHILKQGKKWCVLSSEKCAQNPKKSSHDFLMTTNLNFTQDAESEFVTHFT